MGEGGGGGGGEGEWEDLLFLLFLKNQTLRAGPGAAGWVSGVGEIGMKQPGERLLKLGICC